MSKVNNSIQIHLSEPSRSEAAAARWPIPALGTKGMTATESYAEYKAWCLKYADELQARRDFTGPDFKGCVKDVDFEAGTIAVRLDDGTIYAYPPHAWNRTKAYHTEV